MPQPGTKEETMVNAKASMEQVKAGGARFGAGFGTACAAAGSFVPAGAARRADFEFGRLESVFHENRLLRQKLSDAEDSLRKAKEDLGVLRAGHRVMQRSIDAWFATGPDAWL